MYSNMSRHLPSFFLNSFFSSSKDIQKKQPDDDRAPKASSSSGSSQADIFRTETNGGISQSLMSMPKASEDPSPGETGAPSLPALDGRTAVNPLYYDLGWVTTFSAPYVHESRDHPHSGVWTSKVLRKVAFFVFNVLFLMHNLSFSWLKAERFPSQQQQQLQ